MSVTRLDFGQCTEGRVELYTLRNGRGSTAQVMTLGATLVSLRVPDRGGRLDDIVLGFDSLEPYLHPHPYFGAVIGRFANRIANASFPLQGRRHLLSANDGRHHLHGGSRGFDKCLWSAAAQQLTDGAGLKLAHASPDGDQGYPGTLQAQVTYVLTDDDQLRLDYRATCDAPTVVNLTHHAYFNLGNEASVAGHVLQVAASSFLPVDRETLPLGEIRSVQDTAMDLRRPTLLATALASDDAQVRLHTGFDHNWVLDKPAGELSIAARLQEPLGGRCLCLYTTQPGLQVYTGNLLDGSLAGKQGRHYARHGGICLETQHFPDSPNHAEFPATVLLPGQVYQETTVFDFSVISEAGATTRA